MLFFRKTSVVSEQLMIEDHMRRMRALPIMKLLFRYRPAQACEAWRVA